MTIDVLIDLSEAAPDRAAARAVFESLSSSDGLAGISGQVTCVLPAGYAPWDCDPPSSWRVGGASEAIALSSCALETAARERRPLLVLRDLLAAASEPVSALVECLSLDPMFGFAVARIAGPDGRLAKLNPEQGDPEIDSLPRRVLAALPDSYIVAEVVGSCS